jgi:hypothetical protein
VIAAEGPKSAAVFVSRACSVIDAGCEEMVDEVQNKGIARIDTAAHS